MVDGETFPVEYILEVICVSSYLSESGNCSELNMKFEGTYYNQVLAFDRGSLLHCQV